MKGIIIFMMFVWKPKVKVYQCRNEMSLRLKPQVKQDDYVSYIFIFLTDLQLFLVIFLFNEKVNVLQK